jgi:site-specific recombinase XerD
VTWTNLHLDVLAAERADIELYARCCEAERKARSTIGRRLSTICGFYKYCEQERIIDRNPAAHVRRPKQDYESSTLGLDRNELGAFHVRAGLGLSTCFGPSFGAVPKPSPAGPDQRASPTGLSGGRDHVLALNGLRVSEALNAEIDNMDVNRGHRTLFIRRKGHKTATIPLHKT